MNEIEVQKGRNTEIIQQTLKNQIQLQVNSPKDIIKEKSQGQTKTVFKKWRNIQKIRYLMYLNIYKSELEGYNPQKKMQMYSRMSQFVGTTFQEGCGYYHRQFLKRFKTIGDVIQHLKMSVSYNVQELRYQCSRMKQILKNYQIKIKKELLGLTQDYFNNKSIEVAKFQTINKQINCQLNLSLKKRIFQETKTLSNLSQIAIPIQILIVMKRKSNCQNIYRQQQQLKKVEQVKNGFKQDYRSILPCKRKYLTKIKKLKIKKIKQNNEQLYKQSKDNQQKITVMQNNNMQQSKKIRTCWTKTQTVKLLIFLNIHKENIQYYFHKKKIAISKKCSQYIKTNKTPRSCRRKMTYLCQKIKQPIMKMIEIQTKRLQIPSDLIQKEKELYFYKEKNVFRSKITFASQVINHIISKQQMKQILQGLQSHLKIILQSNLVLTVNFVHKNDLRKNINSKECAKKKYQIKNKEQQFEFPRVKIENHKKIIEIQVQNSIFQIIQSTFKQKLILEQTDFVLLKQTTYQIVNLIKQ